MGTNIICSTDFPCIYSFHVHVLAQCWLPARLAFSPKNFAYPVCQLGLWLKWLFTIYIYYASCMTLTDVHLELDMYLWLLLHTISSVSEHGGRQPLAGREDQGRLRGWASSPAHIPRPGDSQSAVSDIKVKLVLVEASQELHTQHCQWTFVVSLYVDTHTHLSFELLHTYVKTACITRCLNA